MNKIIFSLIILLLNLYCTVSQTESKDSLYSGRVCILILKNGFESDGMVTRINPDTIWFKNEYTEYRIAVNDIKFVRDPDKDYEAEDTKEEEQVILPRDITDECDVYLDSKLMLKNVRLLEESDSTLFVIKSAVDKTIRYEDIRKLVFKPASPFGYGFLYGSAVGFLSGFLPLAFAKGGGHPNYSGPGFGILAGLVFAVPAGLIGGVVGLILAKDDVYLFDKGTGMSKVKRIKYLMNKHRFK